MSRPRFRIEESWDGTGDVTVYFFDATTPDLRDRVEREMDNVVKKLKTEQRTTYHLETIVNGIFSRMKNSGNLKCYKNNWGWVKGE